MIRRWALRLALPPLALAGLAALAAGVFLARPELLLTDRVVAAGIRRFGAAYAPRWSRLSFSAARIGRWRHRYALGASGLCAEDPGGAFKGCLERLEASVVVRFSRRGPRLEILENLLVLGDRVEVDLRRRKPSGGGGWIPPPPFVRALRVELPDVVLRAADLEASGRMSAVLSPGRRGPAAVSADLMTRGTRGFGRLKAGFTVDTDLFNGGVPSYLDAAGSAQAGRLGRARLALSALRSPAGYDVAGSAEVVPSTGPLRAVRLSRCRGSAAAGPFSGDLSCRYELTPAKPPDARFGDLKSPAGGVRLRARVGDGRLSAVLSGTLDPVGGWYELTGGGEARLEGRLGRPLASMTLSHSARATLTVRRFEDLVAFLRETRYAIPAPVHVLKGPVSLALSSRGDPRSDRHVVGYVLTTDLAGSRQRLVSSSTGQILIENAFGPGRALEHRAEILLKEVAFELPRLEIGPTAPKFALDRRIRPDAEPPPAPSSAPARGAARPTAVRSRATVRTGKPLILYSNLAKEPIPAALDLVLAHAPASVGGTVAIKRFDVELFRRGATIDHLNVVLSSGSLVGALEGLVLYKSHSADISIVIRGTTERPRIELTSVPPMKREDIIGLLIFGKNPNELDPDQTASVSNTQTALESRAFGLASLFLFGATPIEHVAYDPATQTTSVKLRLPGGANLTLGSDFDQSRQLSVRKPLSPHWAIQSELSEQGPQSKAAATFLEWLNRY